MVCIVLGMDCVRFMLPCVTLHVLCCLGYRLCVLYAVVALGITAVYSVVCYTGGNSEGVRCYVLLSVVCYMKYDCMCSLNAVLLCFFFKLLRTKIT